ncbi:hypothetical protein RND81_01G103700 [Saponaria officinalis]|uniref:HMG box domain-containing protein n=1 Tax=Saponaria officinalis TaxID=3572 RepID=A0AAW1NEJ2_SAPOF
MKKVKIIYKRKLLQSYIDTMEKTDAEKHIKQLRINKFSIGAEKENPLTQDLHHAVTCLSAELYTKDVHFLMELLQNAEDNQYAEGVEPTLEFVLTTRDITGCGATETLLIFNNEVGFSRQNMESICSVGRSTKKGKKSEGFIGEKGIGFKSVFLVSKQPHIISNGYNVKFNEEPDMHCGIGYIVPEWVSDMSFVSKIHAVYGSENLPTTAIILPLKEDKVESVKEELSSLHPELLLFLTKLKRLYVHTDGNTSKNAGSVTAISIVNETNHIVSRDKDADSRVVHLSVKDKPDSPEEKCQYYMWRQAFSVRPEAKVGGRAHVEKWSVSLAFPFGNRLKRGTSSIGVFAFLPTSMVTNFPFVIQADFILASSRETIMFDNKWNQGILGCVPLAFVNAFTSCVKEGSPVFTAAEAFEFLPSQASPFPELNKVRESIKNKLVDSVIIPCETFSDKMTFSRPVSAVRILPRFRDILFKMKKSGVPLAGISSTKYFPVHSSLDQVKYDPSLNFLGVFSRDEWYEKCITACDLVGQASDKMYLDLLLFVTHYLKHSNITKNLPLLKYSDESGKVKLRSLAKSYVDPIIKYGAEPELHTWLHKCNLLFGCPNKTYFLPNSVYVALTRHPMGSKVFNSLSLHGGVKPCSALEYSSLLGGVVDLRTTIMFAQFLYHSHRKKFLTVSEASSVMQWMPIIDGSGCVRSPRTHTLVPALGSKWVKLLGPSNPFVKLNYVDIGKTYATAAEFAGEETPEEELLSFLTAHSGARDLPELTPPNMCLQVASFVMTSEQAFLLLDWIRFHRTRGSYIPEKFTHSIRSGKWVKTTSGVDCPSNCTVPNETGKAMLQIVENGLSGFSILDKKFYGERISLYTDELQFLGVRCGVNGVQEIVMDHFKLQSSSKMNRATAFSLLKFIGFLKARQLLEEQWLNAMSAGKWLKTFKGYASPGESLFLQSDSEAEAAVIMTRLHVIDTKFYGEKLSSFLVELKLLGVRFESDVYSLAAKNLSFPDNPLTLTSHCGFFMLKCFKNFDISDTSFIEKLRGYPWVKTSTGFSCSSVSVLHEPSWGCLLNVADVSWIDENFYGHDIRLYKDELKALGVAVDFPDALKIIVNKLKTHLSSSVSSTHLITLLQCFAKMKKTMRTELDSMCQLLSNEKILKTRHGFKRPNESILFNSKWASISQCVDLPLVDDSYYGIGIYALRDELKMLGVLSSLKDGVTLVAIGLTRPVDTELLTAEGTISLLFCLKEIMADTGVGDNLCIKTFVENLKKSEFLKTSWGFRLPENTFFFDNEWRDMLDSKDAPFLDDKYYGLDLSAYLDELKVIGVKFDPTEVCSTLSQSLPQLDETNAIKRIYGFLKEFKWKPEAEVEGNWKIWIPAEDGFSQGKWVDSSLCIIKDKAHHFAPILFSLDMYYENDLLPFFSSTFGVLETPSTSHYLQIWSLWESKENHEILDVECCFFWAYILKNWNTEIEDALKKNLVKVPTMLPEGGNRLVNKEHVFVPDDLWLKNIFLVGGDSPSFVWMPNSSIFSVVNSRKLFAVYDALGVRKLSKSVNRSITFQQSLEQLEKADLKKKLIVKGLIEIVLGFLTCKIHMPKKERYDAVRSLLNLSVFENNGDIGVSYQLHLADGRCIKREVEKLVFWDKKSRKLFIDKSFSECQKSNAMFVNFSAVEIAEGLLPGENIAVVNELRNLIQLGFLYEFEEHSIRFLLTRENIEILPEDEMFLASVLTSNNGQGLSEQCASTALELAPLTPNVSQRVKRKRLDEIVSTNKSKLTSNSMPNDSKLKKVVAEGDADEESNKKPKRPLNAFLVFMKEFRKLEHNLGEGTNACGASKWMAMSPLEKAPYIEIAEKNRAEYAKGITAYHRKLEEAQSNDNNEVQAMD